MILNDKSCNGWAAYESKYVEGDASINIHIVEATLSQDVNGKMLSRPTSSLVALCGEVKLTAGPRSYLVATKSEDDMRLELARLQNSGCEICGNCVARFYADGQRSSK